MIVTEYEPEDWKGLRQYVEKSNLVHRSEILGMIDSRLDPDAKEAKIKRTYPEEYRFLLQNCYGSSDISSDSFLKRKTAEQIVYLNCDQQMYSYEQQFSISCLGSLYPQMHS